MTITSGLKPVLGTAQALTSGTEKEFTDVPAWARRITIQLADASLSGASLIRIQLGTASGYEVTNYSNIAGSAANASTVFVDSSVTSGFCLANISAAGASIQAQLTLTLLDPATNTWVMTGSYSTSTVWSTVIGRKALSAALTKIRLNALNGTDTFDAGKVNILYE